MLTSGTTAGARIDLPNMVDADGEAVTPLIFAAGLGTGLAGQAAEVVRDLTGRLEAATLRDSGCDRMHRGCNPM